MTLRTVFVRDDGRLRPGLRALIGLGFLALCLVTAGIVAMLTLPKQARAELGPIALAYGAVAAGATIALARLLDREPRAVAAAGFPGPASLALRQLSLGTLLGAALIGVALLVDLLAGAREEIVRGSGGLPAVSALLALCGAALGEEMFFRGQPFMRTVESLGKPAALAIFAAFFALAHMGNPGDLDAIAVANIALAGVFLGALRLVSGDIWLPWAVHFAWNATQGVIAGVPVSGFAVPSFFRTTLSGPGWVSGGTFGLEGSVGGLAAFAAGLLIALAGAKFVRTRMRVAARG